jgi:hypothetical protein
VGQAKIEPPGHAAATVLDQGWYQPAGRWVMAAVIAVPGLVGRSG